MKKLRILITIVFLLNIMPATSVFAGEITSVSDTDADLEIRTETITQREYSGKALTDDYEMEILTDSRYEQSAEIAKRQEEKNHKLQGNLFRLHENEAGTDITSATARLGLFDSRYNPTTIQATDIQNTNGNYHVVFAVILAGGVGGVVAMMWQKWKGQQSS